MTNHIQEEKWEERFDEHTQIGNVCRAALTGAEYKMLKSFIKETLATQRKEIREKVEGMKKGTVCTSEECKTPSYPICRHKMGYNDAIEDVLTVLSHHLEAERERLVREVEGMFEDLLGVEPHDVMDKDMGPIRTGVMAVTRERLVEFRDEVLSLLDKQTK